MILLLPEVLQYRVRSFLFSSSSVSGSSPSTAGQGQGHQKIAAETQLHVKAFNDRASQFHYAVEQLGPEIGQYVLRKESDDGDNEEETVVNDEKMRMIPTPVSVNTSEKFNPYEDSVEEKIKFNSKGVTPFFTHSDLPEERSGKNSGFPKQKPPRVAILDIKSMTSDERKESLSFVSFGHKMAPFPTDVEEVVTQNWYNEDRIEAIIFSEIPLLREALRVVFTSTAKSFGGQQYTWVNQLKSLRFLMPQIGAKYACFITLAPGGGSNHYILGLLLGTSLLVVDPVGESRHLDFYTELASIQDEMKLQTVYISHTLLQREESLISCGPISVELMRHISQLSAGKIKQALQSASSTKKSRDMMEGREPLEYQVIDLNQTDLLPLSLRELMLYSDEVLYQNCIREIRQTHDRLSRTISKDTFNRDEQVLFMKFAQDIPDETVQLEEIEEYPRLKEKFKKSTLPSLLKAKASQGNSQEEKSDRMTDITEQTEAPSIRLIDAPEADVLNDDWEIMERGISSTTPLLLQSPSSSDFVVSSSTSGLIHGSSEGMPMTFKKELQNLLAARYRFSVKRLENSFIIRCTADHLLGAPMKMKKNLDQLVHLFKLAIGGTGIQEGEHYKIQDKSIKAKSWELTLTAKSTTGRNASSTLEPITVLLEEAGYPSYPDKRSSYFAARPSQVAAALFGAQSKRVSQGSTSEPDLDSESSIACKIQ